MYNINQWVIHGFEWDHHNWPKCASHGVSQAEIEWVFEHEPAVMPDPNPLELRARAIGRTQAGRHVFVAFTTRKYGDKSLIRPISARYMHIREVRHYEKFRDGKTDEESH